MIYCTKLNQNIAKKVINLNTQLKKGNLDLCVLSLLSKRDMYGYELVNSISSAIEISEGTIYPLLKRIRDEGLVTSYLKESSEGPPRKYYTITKEGIDKKNQLAKEWFEFVEAIKSIIGENVKVEENI